jgi:hypothetical protein
MEDRELSCNTLDMHTTLKYHLHCKELPYYLYVYSVCVHVWPAVDDSVNVAY